jgi:para-aminobenzoate N-oxygenase AurF
MDDAVLSLSEGRTNQLNALIDKSHSSHMEVNTVADWAKGANRSIRPKRWDHSWIYGTKHWDALNEEQRLEMLWLENAHLASGFIWLEEGLPPLFIRILHEHWERLPQPIYDYMMIFSKEEIVHTQMFRRYLQAANLPLFRAPEALGIMHGGDDTLVKMHPVAGVICTYLIELAAEQTAMCQYDPEADELSSKIFWEHHKEEARHLAFGKWVCEAALEKFTPEARQNLGYMIRALMSTMIPRFTYNEEIAQYASFDLGICDSEELDRVHRSENNRRLSRERHGAMLDWIKKLGLAPPEYDWFDPVVPPPPQAFERYC